MRAVYGRLATGGVLVTEAFPRPATTGQVIPHGPLLVLVACTRRVMAGSILRLTAAAPIVACHRAAIRAHPDRVLRDPVRV